MNTVERLNAVIEYIEENLDSEINIEEIARISTSSVSDIQKTFSLIVEMPISEYIRKRRMTLAASDLKKRSARVIDVALKYGYDSPTSFARAFQSFHGISPSEVKKAKTSLNEFPRLKFQITVSRVSEMTTIEKLEIKGKIYEAEYLGEADMSAWSNTYSKRKFWRLKDAYTDFKSLPQPGQVLPYNNYPPIDIQVGQVFVIDYFPKSNSPTERKYYISNGIVWNDMPSTTEVVLDVFPLRTDIVQIGGKEYEAEYFGVQDMAHWSDIYSYREYWRVKDAYADFDKLKKSVQVLPYNNYPPINIEIGQAFVIDYHPKSGSPTERRLYIANGIIWNDMESTTEVIYE